MRLRGESHHDPLYRRERVTRFETALLRRRPLPRHQEPLHLVLKHLPLGEVLWLDLTRRMTVWVQPVKENNAY